MNTLNIKIKKINSSFNGISFLGTSCCSLVEHLLRRSIHLLDIYWTKRKYQLQNKILIALIQRILHLEGVGYGSLNKTHTLPEYHLVRNIASVIARSTLRHMAKGGRSNLLLQMNPVAKIKADCFVPRNDEGGLLTLVKNCSYCSKRILDFLTKRHCHISSVESGNSLLLLATCIYSKRFYCGSIPTGGVGVGFNCIKSNLLFLYNKLKNKSLITVQQYKSATQRLFNSSTNAGFTIKNNLYVVILAFIIFLFPCYVNAQQPETLSLDTILSRIDKNNLQLQSYSLRAESYHYTAEASRAWMAPMVGVGTFMTPYPGQTLMNPSDKGSVMLRMEQDIPSKARLNAKRNYIASQANIENAGRGITGNDLEAQAKRLYYTWLIATQRIAVLKHNEELLQMMKKIEEVRYPYNQSQLNNVYRADAKIEENNNMIRMQEGDINKSKAWLNSLMNRVGNEKFNIDTSMRPAFIKGIHDTSSLAGNRKDVLQMNESIKSMQLNIESMKLERRPSFKIQYDNMYPLDAMMPKSFSVMGMISIPIAPWSARMYKNEITAMQYNIKAMETERSAMLQETQGMLYGMQYEIENMQKRIEAMESKILPSLQKSLDASFANYQENKLQLPVVISDWEALNMMQLNILDEKLKLYQMIVDYEKELYR